MRHPIISDTTRTYTIAYNPFNEESDEPAYGFYVGEICPVNGKTLIDGPFETREDAQKSLEFHMSF